jgi:hypothetical protein
MNKELDKKKDDIRKQWEIYLYSLKEENVWITHKYVNHVKDILEQLLNHDNWEKIDDIAYNNKKIFELIVRILRHIIKWKTLEILWNFNNTDRKISWNTIVEYSDMWEKIENYDLNLAEKEVVKKEEITWIIENIINPMTDRLEKIWDSVAQYKEKFKISFNYSIFINKFNRWLFNINKFVNDLWSANQIKKTYLESNIKRIEENEHSMVYAAKWPLQYYIRYLNQKVIKVLNPKMSLWFAEFEWKSIELTPNAVYNFLFSHNILTSMDFHKFSEWINKLVENFKTNKSCNTENDIIIFK